MVNQYKMEFFKYFIFNFRFGPKSIVYVVNVGIHLCRFRDGRSGLVGTNLYIGRTSHAAGQRKCHIK